MSILELSPTTGLPPPSYEGPIGNSLAPTAYRVWLPTDMEPGLAETRPRFHYESSKFSHYYEHHDNLEQLAAWGALGDMLAEAGYGTVRDGETTYTTFPAPASIIAYADKRAALSREEPPFIRFREHHGATFSGLEFLANLRDGFVLISNSTAPYHEYTNGHLLLTENHPRLVHDILLHAPAWLCLPPPITHELQQAAGRLLDERERIVASGEPMHSINAAIGDMMNRIDGTINTYDVVRPLCYASGSESSFGKAIGKITGKQSRTDALRYKGLLRDYASNPFIVGVEHARFIGSTTRKQMQRAA